MSELDLVVEEADAEFDALDQLLNFADSKRVGSQVLQPRSRLVASNASILFVAAAFEESVRQLAQSYIRILVTKERIPEAQLGAIKIGLWERSSQNLAKKALGSKTFEELRSRKDISILLDFCLNYTNVSLMVDNAVYHTRNLKSTELNGIFKRLGISNIANKVGRSIDFRTFFAVPSVGAAEGEFVTFLDDFYEVRNDATHNLGAFRARGISDTRRFIAFFKLGIQRLASVLDDSLAAIP